MDKRLWMAAVIFIVLISGIFFHELWMEKSINEDPVFILARISKIEAMGELGVDFTMIYEFNNISYKVSVRSLDVYQNGEVVVLKISRSKPSLWVLTHKEAPDCVANDPDYKQTWKEFPTCN